MSNLFTINIAQRIDQDMFIDPGAQFTATNNYDTNLKPGNLFTVSDMDTDTLAAFKKVTDYITYAFEASYPVIKIDYHDGIFDFGGSYLRNAASTAAPAALPSGTVITVRFEFSGFVENSAIQVPYVYGSGFASGDIALLEAAGVTVLSTGDDFYITNSVRECKVYFLQPEGTAGKYIFDYPAKETIIQPI